MPIKLEELLKPIADGELHFGITPAKLSQPHESKPWDPIIANVLYRAGIIEKWGLGTLNIIEWCKPNTNLKPSWTEPAGSVILRFHPNSTEALPILKEQHLESQLESLLESLRDRVLGPLSSDPLSKSGIADGLAEKQPSGQLHKVIRYLLDEDAVAHTIPDKPQSRLQKYVLVLGNNSIKESIF